MKRKRILADYERQTGPDGKDKYIYTGPMFSLDLPPAHRRRYLCICWLVPAVVLALFVGMGLLDTEGLRRMYIALPFVGVFMPLALLFGDAYKLTVAKSEMQRAEYERSVEQMRRCTVSGLVLSGIVFLGQASLMLFGGFTTWVEVMFLLCAGVQAALFFFFYRSQKKVKVLARR